MSGYRIKWRTWQELHQKLQDAAEQDIATPGLLVTFADMLARDYRDELAERGKRRVQGYCPMGCGESLYLASSGAVECVKPDCPDPVAVTGVLFDRETEHLVAFDDDGWSAKHPLRERIGDALLRCEIGDAVQVMLKQEDTPYGMYRVMRSPIGPGGWSWERVGE